MFSARRLLAVSAVAIVAVVPITAATLAKQIPGQSSFGDERYVDHIAGDLAIVLTSPHGAHFKTAPLRDRPDAVTTLDAVTEELARTGHRVHLIASQRSRIIQ
jgi:hypothetical protein